MCEFTVRLLIGALAVVFAAQPTLAQQAKPNEEMQAVLDALAKLDPEPLETLTHEEARKQPGPPAALKAILALDGKSTELPETVSAVKDIAFPTAVGNLPARIYTPKGDGPFPVLVYFHGGGWVIANIDAYDASCRALANAAKCIVVSFEYRHAPENPFPAAVDDAFAAYQWTLQSAETWNGDPKRIAVGGESAGGNLAAITTLRARDTNVQPPVHQLLIYPVTNDDFETASYKQHANAKPLNKNMMRWFFGHYLQANAGTALAFPLKARDLSQLPPATIITADIDPLRDDGKLYAAALEKAGVNVQYKNFEGVTHEFFGLGAVVSTSKEAVRFAAEGLRTGFAK